MSIIGNKAPNFTAQAAHKGDLREVKLTDYEGKWLVLFFYPLDFTFVCPTEIIAYSDASEKFQAVNAEVVGCSIDSQFTHLAWDATEKAKGGLGGIQIPLMADVKKEIVTAYGVLNDAGVALRATFIIDPEGVVQHSTINNLDVGRNVDETLRTLKGFQFAAEHGKVCPANWVEGADTMTPSPEGVADYLGSH